MSSDTRQSKLKCSIIPSDEETITILKHFPTFPKPPNPRWKKSNPGVEVVVCWPKPARISKPHAKKDTVLTKFPTKTLLPASAIPYKDRPDSVERLSVAQNICHAADIAMPPQRISQSVACLPLPGCNRRDSAVAACLSSQVNHNRWLTSIRDFDFFMGKQPLG